MKRLIYQLKVSLKYIRPPIWRRFLVPNNITFYNLHCILQIIMGWDDYHLFEFSAPRNIHIGIRDPDDLYECLDAQTKRLNEYLGREGDKILYTYDFGDNWEHEMKLEKILHVDQKMGHPLCIKGKRACPPEDCGGVGGYEDLLEIIKNPEHEEYEEMMEWLEGEFDPEEFDIDFINEELKIIKLK
jgi:hypothetical protein